MVSSRARGDEAMAMLIGALGSSVVAHRSSVWP